MSLILNIDTATEMAHISLAKDGEVLQQLFNDSQKDHAAFLQPSIKFLFDNNSLKIKNIDAVAITAGPGSYTGLRVGMASAKGICYALNKPLITINTLEVLAASAMQLLPGKIISQSILLCPMMDARRMEVYTAIYNSTLETILPPCAMLLHENSFAGNLEKEELLFFGNGSIKWKSICSSPSAFFDVVAIMPEALARLSFSRFNNNSFSDLAAIQPAYLKEFYDAGNK